MKILVTGGAGYIGSHTAVELVAAGHEVVIVDNLSNSHPQVLDRLKTITGQEVPFYKLDVRNAQGLQKVFDEHKFDGAIHFAGLKAVGESVAKPLDYYENNVLSTITLCKVMAKNGVKQLVFSSSATVYGNPGPTQYVESMPLAPVNPYGHTKAMCEQILQDTVIADPEWKVTILRYFNPIGAHTSGLIGEDPNDIPNNLLPFVTQVAVGHIKKLSVFGNDYPTPDGTGVRDYIHVVDLAQGHLNALEHPPSTGQVAIYNLGTGQGYSVFDVVKAFEKASGKKIPYEVVDRRPGDLAIYFADPTKAQHGLKWHAKKGIDDMCADSWRWQSKNPNGYKSKVPK